MKLLITDNAAVFDEERSSQKILYSEGTIVDTTATDPKTLNEFNFDMNAIENECAGIMLERLDALCRAAPDLPTHPAIATRSVCDRCWSMLYPNLKQYLLPSLVFHKIISRFQGSFGLTSERVTFDLSDDLRLTASEDWNFIPSCEFKFRSSPSGRLSLTKELLYKLYPVSKIRKTSVGGKIRILIFLYDTFNDIALFRNFCAKAGNTDKAEIIPVQLSSGIEESRRHDAALLKGPNVEIRYFNEFKSGIYREPKEFYKWIESVHPKYVILAEKKCLQNKWIYYAFAEQALISLSPDVVLYCNTGEAGRAISDVSRMKGIPSVNVEYGLFTDDNIHMSSNIKFTARACLGEASVKLWQKRKDPAGIHISIGFLKLDDLKNRIYDRSELLKKYHLDPDKPVLFFASTWAGTSGVYLLEKRSIVAYLLSICKKHDWTLVIKKHPAENDPILEELLADSPHADTHLFSHEEMDLYEGIFLSACCCTQASSISVEALYFKKPVVFLTLSRAASLGSLTLMKDEPFAFLCSANEASEMIITELIRNKLPDSLFEDAIKKYLHSTDGGAWERLLDLCISLKDKNGLQDL